MKISKIALFVVLIGLFIYVIPSNVGQIYDSAMVKENKVSVASKSTVKPQNKSTVPDSKPDNGIKTKPVISEVDVKSLVKPSIINVTINYDTVLYSSVHGSISGSVFKGSSAELIRDYQGEWYDIKLSDGKTGWIKKDKITIPSDPSTNPEKLSNAQLEKYVDETSLSSSTKYLIWVDLDRQMTYIFEGYDGNWHNIKNIECSTGKNESPTIRGLFKIKSRGLWFYSDVYDCGAKYWVQFNDSYLFHSEPMDENGNIVNPTLGQRQSDGCVRMSVVNSKWIYDNIPKDTAVYVN